VDTVKNIRATLTELRKVCRHVDRQEIESDDYPVIRATMSKELRRAERRLEKILRKLAEEEEEEEEEEQAAEGEGEPTTDAENPASDSETDAGPRGADRDPRSDGSGSADGAEPARKGRGHGRNGAGAHGAAQHYYHLLLAGILGTVCEACGVGRMSRYREKLIVVVKGQPLFDAAIHHFEQARCKLCGAILRAEAAGAIPVGLGSSYITYDWSACAMLLVMHYFAGLPFKRLESLQAGWGIPMPDANQWDIADASADLLFPLYRALERHGVKNALAMRIDDTGSMIIQVRHEIREEIAALEARGESTKDVRTGINATGVYLETEQGKVLLFFTGRHHAGEIVDQILAHRHAAQQNGEKLVKVSDAASKNFSHGHADELEEAVCNAHAYLKFRAVKDRHPEEYGLAGEVYKKVFDNDDRAKAEGMSPQERMRYHRDCSLPEMKRLKTMCREKLQSKLVEPNAPLWEPLTFIINQWHRLTRFCEVPGVPLDTNVVEQMLIIPVRYLAGSFNYKSQNGADVGDRHMSLIATANANGIEPVAYLTECLENHEDLAKRPEHYLPWVYRARLEARDGPGQTSSPSVASSQSSAGQAVVHPLRPGAHRQPLQSATGPPSSTIRSTGAADCAPTCPYATFRHSSGNEQVAGSPPQSST